MSTWNLPLADPPTEPRQRELWLQHVAGYILMHDVRAQARERAPGGGDGIDAALWALMTLIDGVTGAMHTERWEVRLRTHVHLVRRGPDGEEIVQDIDLSRGDGMGMGFAGWLEGDWGKTPILMDRLHRE